MLKLYVDTANAAFADDPGELSRLLREAADSLSVMPDRTVSGRMRDAYGNIAGRWIYDQEEEHVPDVRER